MTMGKEETETTGRNPEEWISTTQAAQILSENHGRVISREYVTYLGSVGRLATWKVDQRTKLYNLAEVKKLHIASTRGRRALENPSDNALRQRKYKQRHGLSKVREPGE